MTGTTPAHDAHAPDDGGHRHKEPTDKQYVFIALLLAVLTAIEIAATEVGPDGSLLIISLLVLMVVKFAFVILFFMHLRFDNKLFSRMFYIGLVFAVVLYSVMLATFHFWTRDHDGRRTARPVTRPVAVPAALRGVDPGRLPDRRLHLHGPRHRPEGRPGRTTRRQPPQHRVLRRCHGDALGRQRLADARHLRGVPLLGAHAPAHDADLLPAAAGADGDAGMAAAGAGRQGRFYRVVRWFSQPVVAAVLFNAIIIITHIPGVVAASVQSGPLHYTLHLAVVVFSLLMWMPVVGPFPELQMRPLGKCIYLFIQSLVPTIPAAWLTFAEGAVYKSYDQPVRVWGMSVVFDQQLAGAIMKSGGGIFLWFVIIYIFFKKFASGFDYGNTYKRGRPMPDSELTGVDASDSEAPLTTADMERAFARSVPDDSVD